MNNSIISWTNVTWNPTHGCSRVSEGCRHCYAERISLSKGFTKSPWTTPNAQENVLLKPHKIPEPYKLKKPSRIFVNSMSDLFHELIPDDYRRRIFQVMADCPQHIFQVLTKRPARAAHWSGPWPENVWMGTSVENTRTLSRLDALRDCPAHVRFISFEPLLEDVGTLDLSGYDWAIVGGESGSGFRPMPHSWARNVRDACQDQKVAFFFKQSSAYKTEMGTSLLHEDDTFWTWQQFPENLTPPQIGKEHKYTYDRISNAA